MKMQERNILQRQKQFLFRFHEILNCDASLIDSNLHLIIQVPPHLSPRQETHVMRVSGLREGLRPSPRNTCVKTKPWLEGIDSFLEVCLYICY